MKASPSSPSDDGKLLDELTDQVLALLPPEQRGKREDEVYTIVCSIVERVAKAERTASLHDFAEYVRAKVEAL